jgi:hypothetical protein
MQTIALNMMGQFMTKKKSPACLEMTAAPLQGSVECYRDLSRDGDGWDGRLCPSGSCEGHRGRIECGAQTLDSRSGPPGEMHVATSLSVDRGQRHLERYATIEPGSLRCRRHESSSATGAKAEHGRASRLHDLRGERCQILLAAVAINLERDDPVCRNCRSRPRFQRSKCPFDGLLASAQLAFRLAQALDGTPETVDRSR